MYYTLKDHQGSLTAAVHGNTVERLSYDAWGRRRNSDGFGYGNVPHTFDRGYTLHEHYDDFGLVNMNGRMYDPVIGRMLSPDITIQDEHDMQAYNRYSYCFNNPLRFTDPSGYVVTIPPDFEDFYYPGLLGRPALYAEALKFKGAENVRFNTDEAEGKTTTTIKWCVRDNSYEMTIVNYTFPKIAQLYAMGCVAACLTMQEYRFGLNANPVYVSNMISDPIGNDIYKATQTVLMNSQVGAYEDGLKGYDAMKYFATRSPNYSNTLESHPHLSPRKGFRNNDDSVFERLAFIEMHEKNNNSTNNAVLFSFYDGKGFSHMMNVSTGIQFQLNNKVLEHEILLWDTDFFNNGGTFPFQTFSTKFEYSFGVIPLKKK